LRFGRRPSRRAWMTSRRCGQGRTPPPVVKCRQLNWRGSSQAR